MEFWHQKKVFITGHTGFIGRHLVVKLRSFGAQVQGCEIDLLRESLAAPGCQNQDYIFHLAAKSPAATDTVNTTQLIQDNLNMTKNVLELARMIGAKVIVASSSHVYSPVTGKEGHPFTESEIVFGKTLSAFGISKQETEGLCRKFVQEYDIDVVVVRMSNVYGPGDTTHRFIPTFIRQCLRRKFPLEVLGNAETVRDFVYIDDVIAGLLRASQISGPIEIINLGSGRATSLAAVADAIRNAVDLNDQPVYYSSSGEDDVSYNVLNINKALQKIGYVPMVSLAEGIQKTVLWWQTQEKIK